MKRRSLKIVIALLLLASVTGCRGAAPYPAQISTPVIEAAAQALENDKATGDTDLTIERTPAKPPIAYQAFPVQGTRSIAEFKKRFEGEQRSLILKVNRIDIKHLRKGDTLFIPDETDDPLVLAPFPLELEQVRDIPKILFVSRRVQAFGAYESGKLVRWGPTSTGKKSTPTPARLYHTNWKAKLTRSTVDSSWILPWCFNLDNSEGISFHQYDLPGYPASHGCVRLLEEDAEWIYSWADQWVLSDSRRSIAAYGTPVIIFGDYNYGAKPPWKRLADDPVAATVEPSEIEEHTKQHLPVIESRARERGSLLAALAQSSF
ncbi:MAG: L,D-transpeptidase [Blastocatellia bacterium]|nr:L,D-transpeptidase [Blastocatellia bacterium]